MNEHFIRKIEIQNFKCFENFKAEGFGRVNLVGGKNNVGKTAFMEALFIASEDNSHTLEFINSFLYLDELRGVLSLDNIHTIKDAMNILQKFNHTQIKTDNFTLQIEYIDRDLESKYLVNNRDTHISYEKANMVLDKILFSAFILLEIAINMN